MALAQTLSLFTPAHIYFACMLHNVHLYVRLSQTLETCREVSDAPV